MQTKPYLVPSTIIKAINSALEGRAVLYTSDKRHMQDWHFNKIANICRSLLTAESFQVDAKNYIIKLGNGGNITFTTNTAQTAECNIIKDN